MEDHRRETAQLENLASFYSIASGFEELQASFDYAALRRQVRGPRVLELGCADGSMTRWLAADGFDVVAVEGSAEYAARARAAVGDRARIEHSLFEAFESDGGFDDVLLANVLHHVQSPESLLARAGAWCAESGRLHVIVPNANSLHRRVALAMGQIDDVHALSTENRRMHHRRVFDPQGLEALLRECRLGVVHMEGIFLKPFTRAQMEHLPAEVLRGLDVVGKRYPELCHHIYYVCRPPR